MPPRFRGDIHLAAPNPIARFHDLGSGYHTRRINIDRRMREHIAQLTAMGYRVTLEPAALTHAQHLHKYPAPHPPPGAFGRPLVLGIFR